MTFSPWKQVSTELPLQDEDSEFTLASDFEIGHFFRERIVPRAVLYFTGEAIEDDDNVGGLGGPCGGAVLSGAWGRRHGQGVLAQSTQCLSQPVQ